MCDTDTDHKHIYTLGLCTKNCESIIANSTMMQDIQTICDYVEGSYTK